MSPVSKEKKMEYRVKNGYWIPAPVIALLLALMYSAPAFGASPGVIDCQGSSRSSVAALSRPDSYTVVTRFDCNQNVSVIGMVSGYAEIQIDANRIGFVLAQYVRILEPPDDSASKPVEPEEPDDDTEKDPAYGYHYIDYKNPGYSRYEIFGGYSFVHWGGERYETIYHDPPQGRLNGSESLSMNGGNAAFTVNINSPLGIKGEFSGIYGKLRAEDRFISDDPDNEENEEIVRDTDLANIQGYSFMAGPQITLRSAELLYLFGVDVPFTAFAHVLFGMEHFRMKYEESPVFDGNVNAFAMAVGGGIDWKKGSWGIRAPQIDYFPLKFGNTFGHYGGKGKTMQNLRISAGVVYRFGR